MSQFFRGCGGGDRPRVGRDQHPGGQGGDPVVRTGSGLVQGVAKQRFDEFLGLPYAVPPVRELRFAPPAAPASWPGVRAADRQAPACLQFEPTGVREEQATSKDCLYLDLHRPRGNTRKGGASTVITTLPAEHNCAFWLS